MLRRRCRLHAGAPGWPPALAILVWARSSGAELVVLGAGRLQPLRNAADRRMTAAPVTTGRARGAHVPKGRVRPCQAEG